MDTDDRVRPLRASDPGRLGRYRLLGRLGAGGMGVVYVAEGARHELVAIKLVHAHLAGDPQFVARFRSELNRARQVPSFCTAEVLDADLDHNPPYLVVEYVDGPSLSEVVQERGPLTPANLHSVAVGVATALAGIHGAGVIHRDLKPQNVLLAPGSPKVIDFGIARAFEATSQHTRTDQFVGTVAYMAPERFDNEPGVELTAAADVFAWGCVVGYAGTGRTPFHGDTPTVTAARILTQPPYLEGLDQPLRDLVERALAKDPADRPTAHEVLDALVGAGTVQRPRPVVEPPPAPKQARRGLVPTLAAAVIVGLTAIFLMVQPPQGARPPVASAPRSGQAGGASTPPQQRAGLAIPSLPIPKISKDPAKPGAGRTSAPPPVRDSGLSHEERLDLWVDADAPPCAIEDETLLVTSSSSGIYPCGHGTADDGLTDQSVTIGAAVYGGDACVGYWFHWFDASGGDLIRVCREEVTVGGARFGDTALYGRLVVESPPATSEEFTTRLDIRGDGVTVYRDGRLLGAIPLGARAPEVGRSVLGMAARSERGGPPYRVAIHDVEMVEL